MRKRTDFQTPEDRKASPNQTKGLIAKGQKSGESVQEECVLDNLSHRTFQKLPARRSRAVLPGANEVSGSGNFIVF